jgi:hypothetical protein
MPLIAQADIEPIRLPGSPFWNVFKRFGRDEMVALIVSVIGTLVLSFFTSSALMLALAGPVIEKVGFFPAHLWDGYKLYRAAPQSERKPLSSYLRTAMKGGSVSLVEDLLVHDPLYIALFLWLSTYAGMPLWVIASFSFIVAVAAVAALEVAWTEARYARLKRRLKLAGFEVDSYREARFFIRTGQHAEGIIKKLQEGLSMRVVETLRYSDRYFTSGLPAFSGRSPVLRLRQRTAGVSSDRYNHLEHIAKTGFMQSLQLVYILPQEEETDRLEQFRFFSVRKDKFYFPLDMDMPAHPSDIPGDGIPRIIRAGKEYKHLQFERTIMLDDTGLLYAGVDRKRDDEEGCVVELKIRQDLPLLLSAMRFVMREFPVTHTTRQKTELALF